MRTGRGNIIDASSKLSAKLDSEIDTNASQLLLDSVPLSSQYTADRVKIE